MQIETILARRTDTASLRVIASELAASLVLARLAALAAAATTLDACRADEVDMPLEQDA